MRILLIVCLILALLTIGASKPSAPASAWEYKFEYKCTEKKANELAANGWELVAMSEGSTGIFSVCAFKRPK